MQSDTNQPAVRGARIRESRLLEKIKLDRKEQTYSVVGLLDT